MKGLIYREFYLSRKPILLMLLVYVLFVVMISLVIISTYAGNLADDSEVDSMREYLNTEMYLYAGFIAIIGSVYGHNDIIEKDYKSRWQLYSYTVPVNEKKIAASKFIVRGILLIAGFILAVIADVIFSAAAKYPLKMGHFKNILVLMFGYGAICFLDIPFMLRLKTQAKNAAVGLAITTPLMAGAFYGAYRFVKFCAAEGKRLYPKMDSSDAIKAVAMPYIHKWRDALAWITPVAAAVMIVLLYFMTVKELKRRRY